MSASVASPTTSPTLNLLTRLGLAIARRRAYGDVHPMVEQADSLLATTLAEYLAEHSALALGVARRELIVNGEAATGGIAQDLAARLHHRNIGAVRFHGGVTRESTSAFVRFVSQRPSEVNPDEPLPELAGITLGRVDFEHLGLADDEAIEAETSQLWRALAQRVLAAVESDGTTTEEAAGSPATIGAALTQAAENEHSALAAFEALNGMAEQVALAPRRVRDEIGERLQALLSATDQGAIVAALRAGGSDTRARLVSNMVDVLPAAAVVRWLNSAAKASERDLSPHLLRLLSKMSVHFRGRRPDAAAEELRETARDLVEGWDLTEPNPEEHAGLLETLAAWSARAEGTPLGRDTFTDPRSQEASRLVQMAIELGTISDDAALAVKRLADEGHAAVVLSWIERGANADMAATLRNLTFTPSAILQVLLAEPFDATEARKLLEVTPPESSGVLLEALERSESRTGRRLIFDRLRTMPASIVPSVCTHLSRAVPWYFARNLLALLRDLLAADPSAAADIAVGPLLLFQRHEQVPVRREAVRTLTQLPATRAAALRRALDDADADVRRAAIDAAFAWRSDAWPADVAQRLMVTADDESLEQDVREKTVRTLTGTVTPDVRNWLVTHVSRKSTLLGGRKLAPATPMVRAAMHILATRHAEHAEVAPLVALARKAGLVGAGA